MYTSITISAVHFLSYYYGYIAYLTDAISLSTAIPIAIQSANEINVKRNVLILFCSKREIPQSSNRLTSPQCPAVKWDLPTVANNSISRRLLCSIIQHINNHLPSLPALSLVNLTGKSHILTVQTVASSLACNRRISLSVFCRVSHRMEARDRCNLSQEIWLYIVTSVPITLEY